MNVGFLIQDKYRVTGFLGEGAVGVVYLAEHLALDKLCAIKVLKHNLLQDHVAVERFRREALAASRLVHPNIVSVFDFGQLEDGSFYFAMDHVRGQPLNQVIQGVGMDVDRACRLLRQLADALAYAHGKGVVHRDIKPDNVMLEGYPHKDVSAPKILDFGLAKFVRERLAPITVKGQLFGTPEYMAPEQIATGDVDHRTDIYSFGAMAFEVLTGQTPFSGGFLEQLTAHRRTLPPRPSDIKPGEIPPELDGMVQRCMAKKPADRYASALEIVAILDAVLADRAVRRSFRSSSGSRGVIEGGAEKVADSMTAAKRICDSRWSSHEKISTLVYQAASELVDALDDSDGLALALARAVLLEDRARGLRTEVCDVLSRVETVESERRVRRKLLRHGIDVLQRRKSAASAKRGPELEEELDRQIDVLVKQMDHLDTEINSILQEQHEWLAVLVRRFLQARSELSDYASVLARMILDAREHVPDSVSVKVDWAGLKELVTQSRWEWADHREPEEGHSGPGPTTPGDSG